MNLPTENDMYDLFTNIVKETLAVNKDLEAETVDKDAVKAKLKKINAAAGLGKAVMNYKVNCGE